MADDSRDTSSLQEAGDIPRSFNANPDSKKTKHEPASSQTGKLWDAFGNPEEPANALAKATYKPPGKDPKDASYSEIIGSVSLSELSTIHKRPCARESLMTGIGVGFGVGGLRGVLKGIVLCFVVCNKGRDANMCMQDAIIYGLQAIGLSACSQSPHWQHMSSAATDESKN